MSIEILLTNQERELITQIPADISNNEIIKYYTLSKNDLEIIGKRRNDYNKIGFALQICLLRHKGWTINNYGYIPESIIQYVSKQINVKPKETNKYLRSERNVVFHLREICNNYKYRNFQKKDHTEIKNFLSGCIIENDNCFFLIEKMIEKLKNEKIILPGITIIEKITNDVINQFEENILNKVNEIITEEQKKKIDSLLISDDGINKPVLSWLRDSNGRITSKEINNSVEKKKFLDSFNFKNISNIIPKYKAEHFIRLGKKYDIYSLKRFEDKKRYAVIAVFLDDLRQSMNDKLVIINDIKTNSMFSKARKSHEENIKREKNLINELSKELFSLADFIMDIKNNNRSFDVEFKNKFNKKSDWNNFQKNIDFLRESVKTIDKSPMDYLNNYYSSYKRYSEELLNSLELRSSTNIGRKVISALDYIKNNDIPELPDDANLDFMNKKWREYINGKTGSVRKHYYILALSKEIKDCLRSGDIYVPDSKNYKNFEDYLVSPEEWKTEKNNTRIIANLSADDYFKEKEIQLDSLLKWYSKNKENLQDIIDEDEKLHIRRLERNTPEEAKQLSQDLYKLIPRINLPDLLIEVSNMTEFHKHFIHASTGQVPKTGEEINTLIFAIMAIGTNVGLSKMAESVNNISYRQLSSCSDWNIYDETLSKVQVALVNYQKKEPFSQYWGRGNTSSSDGMRIKSGSESINSGYNPHFGLDKGVTIYRFVSDIYCAFYSTVNNPNVRDGLYVIDGYLYHNSELKIHEHYTDTAGYTEQIFALTPMMGFNFAPRIKNLKDAKLYSFDKEKYPKLKKLVSGVINKDLIRENYDNVLRLAHSVYEKKVLSSTILGKLGSYSRNNSLANALKEMGRIEKTIFILEYASNIELRKRIQAGLNKGEEMNALARAVFFGRRGYFWEHDFQEQFQKASCLNLILNAIVIWNTKYLKKAWNYYKYQNPNASEKYLKHVSPLNWEHINFLGEYNIENNPYYEEDNLRMLNLY